MFLLFPLNIETLERHRPWMNWTILAVTVITFFLSGGSSIISHAAESPYVLKGWNLSGMFGHMFLHADFWHLAGNMVFLWVFGNVICQTTGNLIYPLLYFGTGLCAAAFQLIMSDAWAVGASGAISGITGLTLALFPLNRVEIGYLFVTRTGSFQIKVVTLCVISILLDLVGTLNRASGTAHWAHIGGLLSGAAIGLTCLHFKWIVLSCFDNKSLYEMLTGRELERSQDELDTENSGVTEDWAS